MSAIEVAPSQPVTEAALTLLRTTGKLIGDAKAPDGAVNAPKSFFPYAVVYTGLVTVQGSAVAPKEDGVHRVQVTSVSVDRVGVEWMRDQARSLLLDRTAWSIAGHEVIWTDLVVGQDVARDDDVTPPRFYAVDVVDLLVTPVSGS